MSTRDARHVPFGTLRTPRRVRSIRKLAKLSFNSPPVVVGDRVYALGWLKVGTIDAVLVCLDAATGRAHWKTVLVENQIDLTMFGDISHEPFLGNIAVHDGVVYANSNLGAISAVDAGRWSRRMDRRV